VTDYKLELRALHSLLGRIIYSADRQDLDAATDAIKRSGVNESTLAMLRIFWGARLREIQSAKPPTGERVVVDPE
jgi:hypothetical protein